MNTVLAAVWGEPGVLRKELGREKVGGSMNMSRRPVPARKDHQT